MNPIALSIADATAFFFGLTLIFLSELFHFVRASKNSSESNGSDRKTASRLINVVLFLLIVLGSSLVLISSTPLPKAMYLIFFLLVVGNLFLQSRFAQKTRKKFSGTVLFATLILIVFELPYHLLVRFSVPETYEIYVIGDSLSAGAGSKETPWPTQLEKLSGRTIINLAQPGATVQDAV